MSAHSSFAALAISPVVSVENAVGVQIVKEVNK